MRAERHHISAALRRHRSDTSRLARRFIGAASMLTVLAACGSGDGDRVAIPGAPTPNSATTVPATSPATTTASPPPTATTTATAEVPTTNPGTAPVSSPAPTSAAATTVATAPAPAAAPEQAFYRAGDEGPEIAIIQLKLSAVGFLEAGYEDGVFDQATNQAVLEFQGQYGLIVDGVVGPATDRALTAAAVSVDADG